MAYPAGIVFCTLSWRCETKSPFACICFSMWGRVVIVLVNERVSINTPRASFSVSTSNQLSVGQLRESNESESRLMGDRVGEGQEVSEGN